MGDTTQFYSTPEIETKTVTTKMVDSRTTGTGGKRELWIEVLVVSWVLRPDCVFSVPLSGFDTLEGGLHGNLVRGRTELEEKWVCIRYFWVRLF